MQYPDLKSPSWQETLRRMLANPNLEMCRPLLKSISANPSQLLDWINVETSNPHVVAELRRNGVEIILRLLYHIVFRMRRKLHIHVAARVGLSAQGKYLRGDGILDPTEVLGWVLLAALAGESATGGEGKRNPWNPEKQASLLVYLIAIADSCISHRADKERIVSEEFAERPAIFQEKQKKRRRVSVGPVGFEQASVLNDYSSWLTTDVHEVIANFLDEHPEFVHVINWKSGEVDHQTILEQCGFTKRALENQWYRLVPKLIDLLAAYLPERK